MSSIALVGVAFYGLQAAETRPTFPAKVIIVINNGAGVTARDSSKSLSALTVKHHKAGG